MAYASLDICCKKWACTFQRISIRKKDCRGANASSILKKSGIEHFVQVMLTETACNSAEATKAENAFKEKKIQCLTDPVNPRRKKEKVPLPYSLSCFNPLPPFPFYTYPWLFFSL